MLLHLTNNIVCSEIAQIFVMFIVASYDLKVDLFNEDTNFHILSKYGSYRGHLKRLQFEVSEKIFYGFKMQ